MAARQRTPLEGRVEVLLLERNLSIVMKAPRFIVSSHGKFTLLWKWLVLTASISHVNVNSNTDSRGDKHVLEMFLCST